MNRLRLALLLVCATTSAGPVFHGIAVSPDGQNAWAVAIDTVLVIHTTDFGSTWEHQSLPTIRNIWDVCCTDGLTAWTCGMAGDIWQTSDGGENWSRQNLGGPKHAARIRFFDANHGWAAGGDMVQLSTTDGGQEWTQKLVPDPPIPSDTTEYNGVSFVTPHLGWIVAGRWPSGDTYAGGQGYIVRTTDRGDNWELQLVDTVFDFYDCHFCDESTGIVVGGDDRSLRGVVLRTSDGGATWVQQPVPAATRFLRTVCFVSASRGWACGRSGTIIHTSDGGLTWTLQLSGVDTTLFDIEFADSLRGMAGGNSIVLRTTDGGVTWERSFGAVSEQQGPGLREKGGLRIERPNLSSVRFVIHGRGRATVLTVFDASGRAVRSWAGLGEGSVVCWDGRGADKRRAPSGVYIAVLGTLDCVSHGARFVIMN